MTSFLFPSYILYQFGVIKTLHRKCGKIKLLQWNPELNEINEKAPSVNTAVSASPFDIFFYIFRIPFQRYSENREHYSCQNISKIFWKQAEPYRKAKPLLYFTSKKEWFIFSLINRVETPGAMDETREPGTPWDLLAEQGER